MADMGDSENAIYTTNEQLYTHSISATNRRDGIVRYVGDCEKKKVETSIQKNPLTVNWCWLGHIHPG